MKNLVFLLILCCTINVGAQNPIEPAKYLPEIHIQTEYGIYAGDKVKAKISFIDIGFQHRELNCGIELRGNSTLLVDKKSYDFELISSSDEELAQSIFGFPAEEDFVLLANSYDKSFVRNALAFKMWELLGHYAPKYIYCNLYLNGELQGLYMLAEKVKADLNRIDLRAGITQNGNLLDYGFMVKLDWESSPHDFGYYHRTIGHNELDYSFVSPKESKVGWGNGNAIEAQLKSMASSFEDILVAPEKRVSAPYSDLIDVNSFVDFFLVNELCKNPDGLKTSTYLYHPAYYELDKNPQKISVGPIWDMDLGLANVKYENYESPEGWAFHQYGPMSNVDRLPNWWHCLVYDSTFISLCQERLFILKEKFSMNSGGDFMDQLYVQLEKDAKVDDELWGGTYEGLTVFGPVKTNLDEQIVRIRDFYVKRFAWIENNLDKIEKVHPAIAYLESLNLTDVEADTVKQVFDIELPGSGVQQEETSGIVEIINPYKYDQYVVKSSDGTIVAEGQPHERFLISYEGWVSGDYYLEIVKEQRAIKFTSGIFTTNNLSICTPTYSGTAPYISFLSFEPTLSAVAPTVSYVQIYAPSGLSAPIERQSGYYYPQPVKHYLKLKLIVP